MLLGLRTSLMGTLVGGLRLFGLSHLSGPQLVGRGVLLVSTGHCITRYGLEPWQMNACRTEVEAVRSGWASPFVCIFFSLHNM